MSLATARGPLQAPLSQWVMVGVGALYLSNPEKFVSTIQQSFLTMLGPGGITGFTNDGSNSKQTIIYQTLPSNSTSSSKTSLTTYIIQLTFGAGLCWGTYMILMEVLPDAAKGMLPVSTSVFNAAVKTLGHGILSIKERLLEQLGVVSAKQDELSAQQGETHKEILDLKDSANETRGDLGLVRESLDTCLASLGDADLKAEYIARGVRLLSRGVSSILPRDHDLAYELDQFNREALKCERNNQHHHHHRQVDQGGQRLSPQRSTPGSNATTSTTTTNGGSTPAVSLLARQQQQLLQQARTTVGYQQHQDQHQEDNPQQQTPIMKKQVSLEDMDPENEVPITPVSMMTMEGLDEVRLLLNRVKAAGGTAAVY